MATNRSCEIPFGNGETAPEIEIVLSTGYMVVIDPKTPVESFDHLARAFVGEIFLKLLSDAGDTKLGVKATIREISSVVEGLGPDGAQAALKVALWAEFLRMYETVRKGAGRGKTRRRRR